jgi:F0F1-type ATP synthase assembly protein I
MSRLDAGQWLTSRALLCQMAIGALVALTAMLWGRYAALSVLGGASMVWVTNLYIKSRARVTERTVAAALVQVLIGELIKVMGTVAMFAVAARVPHLVWPALLLGYVAALVASWVTIAAPSVAVTNGLTLRAVPNQRLEP